MSKRDAARPGRLEALNQINHQLSLENAELREYISGLGEQLRSPTRRYVDRLVHDVLWGDPRTKAAVVPELASQAVQRVLPAVRSLPDQARFLLDRALSHLGTLPTPYGPIVTPGYRERFYDLLKANPNQKIALSLSGGLGDGVWLSAVAAAIRQKYIDADIYIFTPNTQFAQIFAHNRCVKGIIGITQAQFVSGLPRLLGLLLRGGRLDMWFECKYVTKVHYGRDARVDPQERRRTEAAFAQHYLNFDEFPLGANLVSAHCARHGMNLLDLVGRSALLDMRDQQMFTVPSEADMAMVELTRTLGEYVTIHHGCDPQMAGPESRVQTKNWFHERWEAIVAYIHEHTGVQVVQIGTADEQPLRGAIHAFMGQTTVNQAALLLKGARFHMDTEGGMVHLARTVHTPSLVLFGPTALGFFSYPGNINLQEGDCHECWWSTLDWYRHCPRGLATPECMDAVSTQTVTRAVTGLLSMAPPRARQELRDLTLFGPELLYERLEVLRDIHRAAELVLLDPVRDALNEVTGAHIYGSKSWEYLYCAGQIGELAAPARLRVLDAGAGRGALSLYLASAGHEVEICDVDFGARSHTGQAYENRFLKRAAARGVRFRFGSLFNLPYEPDWFDVVCCSSLLQHGRYRNAALSELLRVLRPGGVLLWTFELQGEARTDSRRTEALNEDGLAELLGPFGMGYARRPLEIERSASDIQRLEVAGVPAGCTVAGACIVKREPERRSRRLIPGERLAGPANRGEEALRQELGEELR